MTQPTDSPDPEIEALLAKLAEPPARDPEAATRGRAAFMNQARAMEPGRVPDPAVSKSINQRPMGWKQILPERILINVKPYLKVSSVVAALVLAVAVLFLATNANTVSAQQILERASAAQSAVGTGTGIWHNQIRIFDNPQAIVGGGTTTVVDSYLDVATGLNRYVTTDDSGKVIEVSANDGKFDYYSHIDQPGDPLPVFRSAADPNNVKGGGRPVDADALAKNLFESFRSNPRVEVQGQVTRPDGRKAYVLVNHNYQTENVNGQTQQTLTGATTMIFDVQTYALLETETTLRKDNQDVTISKAEFLVDELLPTTSTVAWNLSDLPGITIVDEAAEPDTTTAQADPQPITVADVSKHAGVYLLGEVPAGFTLAVVAAPNQPTDQPYAYEATYSGPNDQSFDIMAVGTLDDGFVDQNFYDGSYKATNGLMVHYSPSSDADSTSAMLTSPDGKLNYLIGGTFTREEVQKMVEGMVLAH